MSIEENNFPHRESDFDKLLKSKEVAGWHFVGREGLTHTKAREDRRFVEVPYQTEDSIKEKYLQLAKHGDPVSEFEIDLVLDENTDKLRRFREISTEEEYRSIVSNLREADRTYLVFVRKVVK